MAVYVLTYDTFEVAGYDPGLGTAFIWDNNDAYKTLVFDTDPTGELLAWLQKKCGRTIRPGVPNPKERAYKGR